MPFIPHTSAECEQMLRTMGLDSLEDLFDEIPKHLLFDKALALPEAFTQAQCLAKAEERFSGALKTSFLGAGAYQHAIPPAIFDMMSRGEWLTAYTPYQAEASQGTLQMLFEYQSAMAGLMSMPAFNASLYDGASALLEAVLMAFRLQKKHTKPCLVVPESLHPSYRKVLETGLSFVDVDWVTLPMDEMGRVSKASIANLADKAISALVISSPTFFGQIEDVDGLTDAAHDLGAVVIACVNPLAMGWLKPPGLWGKKGVDIVCGEAQSLGVPLSYGGLYLGFMGCQKALVRQLPGRIVGRTKDADGKVGYVLTLQAREQHIRRSKATSNICTNQGVYALAVVMYLSLLGPDGLARVAEVSHRNTVALVEGLCQIEGVERLYAGPYFHECAVKLPLPADQLLTKLRAKGFVGGLALGRFFSDMKNGLLVCATDAHTSADIADFVGCVRTIVAKEERA